MNMNIDNIDVEEAVNISTYTNDIYLNACKYYTTDLTSSSALPAKEAMQLLQDGNKRFITNNSILINNTQAAVGQLPTSQHPFAVVFGCSDSRLPPPVVFNVGVGEIFEARTAGEIIYNNFDTTQNSAQVGESVQFGVNVLGVRLLLIMGHTNCGAVIYTQNYFNANTTTPQQPAPSDEPYNVIYNSLYNAYEQHTGGSPETAPNSNTIPIVLSQAEDVAKYLYENYPIIKDEVLNKNNNPSGPLQIWTAIYNDAANIINGYSASAGEVSNYKQIY